MKISGLLLLLAGIVALGCPANSVAITLGSDAAASRSSLKFGNTVCGVTCGLLTSLSSKCHCNQGLTCLENSIAETTLEAKKRTLAEFRSELERLRESNVQTLLKQCADSQDGIIKWVSSEEKKSKTGVHERLSAVFRSLILDRDEAKEISGLSESEPLRSWVPNTEKPEALRKFFDDNVFERFKVPPRTLPTFSLLYGKVIKLETRRWAFEKLSTEVRTDRDAASMVPAYLHVFSLFGEWDTELNKDRNVLLWIMPLQLKGEYGLDEANAMAKYCNIRRQYVVDTATHTGEWRPIDSDSAAMAEYNDNYKQDGLTASTFCKELLARHVCLGGMDAPEGMTEGAREDLCRRVNEDLPKYLKLSWKDYVKMIFTEE